MREVQKVKLNGCATIFNRPNYVINSSKKNLRPELIDTLNQIHWENETLRKNDLP